MFYSVDPFNQKRTGVCIRKVVYIALSALAAVAIIVFISFSALAGQFDSLSAAALPQNSSSSGATIANLHVVEEIDLGDQGIFPAGHELATIHVDGQVYTCLLYTSAPRTETAPGISGPRSGRPAPPERRRRR